MREPVGDALRLPRLLADGMVLQRDAPARIWGWAAPGETVAVSFNGHARAATASADGSWSVLLPPSTAGGPYTMEVHAGLDLAIRDILVGDVWICSGQSNMVIPMARVRDLYPEEISGAADPDIRQFTVPDSYDFNSPRDDLSAGSWEKALPANIMRFSAVGYFFAKALRRKLKVPVGLILSAVGGSPVEAWMSEDALREFPAPLEAARRFADKAYHDRIRDEEAARVSAWHEGIAKRDMGLAGGGPPWFDPALDDSSWRTMKIPAFLDEGGMGPVNGVVWFRKHVDVPASMTGRPALLRLGRIVDSDTAYMNGVCVGTVGYQYPPRRYEVPDNLLLPGRNTIAVRVVSSFGRGGFIKDKPYQLEAGGEAVDLRGDWRCRIGTVEEPLVEPIRILCKPLGLFNAMIAPLLSYSMKGVIWYQGESNDSRPEEYRGLFSAMIRDWRSKWKLGDFPFLYVQLHNFMEPQDLPSESSWALLREAQLHSLSIPNTAMATAVDLGEWNDLHPLRKRDVGYRLALAAFKTAYGDEGVVYSGPLYWSKKTEGGAIRISFTHVGGGLRARDGELRHFAICGPDGRFVWARAEIQDNSVLVRSDRIKRPVAVRYAWADNPEKANLYNAEGLPASPFRTDGA